METRYRFSAWRAGTKPYLSYWPARVHRLAKSIPRNRFLGSINVYKYGLWRARATTLFFGSSVPSPHRLFKNSSSVYVNGSCIFFDTHDKRGSFEFQVLEPLQKALFLRRKECFIASKSLRVNNIYFFFVVVKSNFKVYSLG